MNAEKGRVNKGWEGNMCKELCKMEEYEDENREKERKKGNEKGKREEIKGKVMKNEVMKRCMDHCYYIR